MVCQKIALFSMNLKLDFAMFFCFTRHILAAPSYSVFRNVIFSGTTHHLTITATIKDKITYILTQPASPIILKALTYILHIYSAQRLLCKTGFNQICSLSLLKKSPPLRTTVQMSRKATFLSKKLRQYSYPSV